MPDGVYIGTRIPEELKLAFQEALEKDGRQYSISQILRHWIEMYVVSTQDRDQSLDQMGEFRGELSQIKQELASKIAINEELFKLVTALYKLAPVQNKDQHD